MARHSKGKHAAKKAAIKRQGRRADADQKKRNGSAAAPSNAPSVPSLKQDARQAKKPEPSDTMPVRTDSVPAGTASPTVADAGRPKHAASPKGATVEEGQAAFASDFQESPSASSMAPAGKEKRSKRSFGKRVGIAAAIVVGILGIAYVGTAGFFFGHFFPNTSIAMVDISMDSPEQAAVELDETVGNFSFKVKGQGMNLTVTSEQAGMNLDSEAVVGTVLDEQVPWGWPVQIFRKHDVTARVADAMSASALSGVIEQAVAEVNAKAQAPVDATVVFKDDVGKFYIAPEVEGTMLDAHKVIETCMEDVLSLKKDVVLRKEARLDPAVYSDDQRLVDACAKANQLARADVTFMLDGNPAANVNAITIGSWVTVTPEFEVLFNDDELALWAEGIAGQFDTVGSERTYTRPDGKVVTVKGGPYGWKVDGEALEAAAVEAIQNGVVGSVEIPVLQSGRGFTALGSQDWGARYVDVDLSEQYARFYDNGGNLVWESDIVSGAKGTHDSPTGVYTLNNKQSPTVLIGEMTSDGTPEYESRVTYWMPFKGNSVGLHDASWQSAFGGQRYASGFGSHGCINLPTEAAGELYGLIEPGDVVVVHY